MADNKINVGGRLHSIATGNLLVGADEIFDDDKNKKQSDINTETYVLVNEVNEKLATLSPEQQSALAVATKANKNEANLGYYVCDTESNIAAKVIANATGYILEAGGSIKIKMNNANTAYNVTLNINSTGAKPLYYCGEIASATNTWEDGETVEVYYDGINFYANNIAGCSNFATGEKIKNVGIDDEAITDSDNLVTSGGVAKLIDTTHLTNPTEKSLAKTEDVVPLKSKLQNINFQESKVDIVDNVNIIHGYCVRCDDSSAGRGVLQSNAYSSYFKLQIPEGTTNLRFLGSVIRTTVINKRSGFAFGNYINDVWTPVTYQLYDVFGEVNSNKEYIIKVPEGVTYCLITVYSNSDAPTVNLDNFYCYTQNGSPIVDFEHLDEKLEGVLRISDIVNNLTSESEDKILSAKQGKVLNKKILLDNYHFTHIDGVAGERITELDNLPIGTQVYRCYEDVSNDNKWNNLRYYYTLNGASANKLIYPSQTIVIGELGETDGYFVAVNDKLHGNISVIINPHTDNKDNALKYGTIGLNNLVGENVIFDVKNREISTTDGTDIWGSGAFAIPKIPKGAIVHIDFDSAFSNWLSRYRVYLNGASTYTNVVVQRYVFEAADDITSIRVRIANADILSGQTPPTVNVKMWWEDVAIQFKEIKNKVTPLLALDKQSFADANPSGYDAENDKFTEGEYIVELATASNTVAVMDIIANYVAKYISSGDTYPYLQMRYHYTNNWNRWWKYPIGGKDYYKFNQCKLVCPGTDDLGSTWDANIQIRIVVPEGCELYLKNINAEFSNSLINKDAFKVFQHGTERITTGGDNKTNWDLWSHIGNYGAIVIPKRTTDGKWVCYHDDEFGNNPKVQVIGDPSASLPANSIQECTYAETQTLEYKGANFYGDHDTIPLLSEFFAKCAQMGVHPALSCHPTKSVSTGWTVDKWSEVKELACKYRVLDKLTIKSSYGAEAIQNFYEVFGNEIESYIADVNSEPTQDMIDELAGIGWDLDNVKVGFELVVTDSYFSDETISAIESANLIHGIAPGAEGNFYKDAKNLKDIIDKGCYEITADQFYSNGLNWA